MFRQTVFFKKKETCRFKPVKPVITKFHDRFNQPRLFLQSVIILNGFPFNFIHALHFFFCFAGVRLGGAAWSSNGGHRGFIPGPADPWHKAGSPVQCWYQHFGAGPESRWQHDQWEQKPLASTADPCAGAGRLPGVLWCRRKFLLIVFPASLFHLHCDKCAVCFTAGYILTLYTMIACGLGLWQLPHGFGAEIPFLRKASYSGNLV